MTKQHFERIAYIMNMNVPSKDADDYEDDMYQHGLICGNLADYFATDNPKFDRARFLQACGVTK